ncbi:MAG: hypothetical protein J1E01_08120 [Acetatifactor sp.]|nr:hypothetical protein [Acetatifactor sp.]
MKKRYLIGAGICLIAVIVLIFVSLSDVPDGHKENFMSASVCDETAHTGDEAASVEGGSAEAEIIYRRPDFDTVFAYIDKLEEDLDLADSLAYRAEFGQLSMLLMDIATSDRLLMIERYDNLYSEELIDEYGLFYDRYESLYLRYAQYFDKLVASDKFSCISADWTAEEIEAEKEVCRILDGVYYDYDLKMNGLMGDFYRERADGTVTVDGEEKSLMELLGSDEYSDVEKERFSDEALSRYHLQIRKIYLDIVRTNNNLAVAYGYGDYERYLVAGKDTFEREELVEVYRWVRDELVPLYYSIYGSLTEPGLSEETGRSYTLDETLGEIRTGLADLSPDMLGSFDRMIESGHCGIDAHEGKSTNNFTTYLYSYGFPYVSVYLYGKYIDRGSILHEFGHYYAYEKIGPDAEDNLCPFEAMAQMMNAMYWAERFGRDGLTTDVRLNILSILQTAILSSVIDELEHYIYTAGISDSAEIDRKYKELLCGYGLLTSDDDVMGIGDWTDCTLLFTSPFYYRNYLLSSIPTLMVLAEGLEDWGDKETLGSMVAMYNRVMEECVQLGHCLGINEIIASLGSPVHTLSETLSNITKNVNSTLQIY